MNREITKVLNFPCDLFPEGLKVVEVIPGHQWVLVRLPAKGRKIERYAKVQCSDSLPLYYWETTEGSSVIGCNSLQEAFQEVYNNLGEPEFFEYGDVDEEDKYIIFGEDKLPEPCSGKFLWVVNSLDMAISCITCKGGKWVVHNDVYTKVDVLVNDWLERIQQGEVA